MIALNLLHMKYAVEVARLGSLFGCDKKMINGLMSQALMRNVFDTYDENHISKIEPTYASKFREAYYIAIGKERNNIYKMNAVINSQGFEILGESNTTSKKTLKEIKAIEVVFGSVVTTDKNENILSYKVKVGNYYLNDAVYSISSNSSKSCNSSEFPTFEKSALSR